VIDDKKGENMNNEIADGHETAKACSAGSPDGSVPEAEVCSQCKRIVDIDDDAEREGMAKHIIDTLCEEGTDEDSGQLSFPGFGTWHWEPRRLVRSDNGDLIENKWRP
jgi:hypothetical protein